MNVSSAKNKIKQEKYDEAITLLNKELKVNPSSEPALELLYTVYSRTNQPEKQFETLTQLEKVAKDPKVKKQLPSYQYQFWVSCYNNTVRYYNMGSKDSKYLDSALIFADMGIKVKPYNTLLVPIKGSIYETMGKSAEATKTYENYVANLMPTIDFMAANKVYMDSFRKDNISNLGQPKESRSTLKDGTKDSLIVDFYTVDNKDVYIGYNKKFMDENAVLASVKYDIPATLPDSDKFGVEPLNVGPISVLFQRNFQAGNYDKAIEYAELLQKINPTDEQINSYIIACYQKAGKMDEVLARLKNLITENPRDYKSRTQYAGFLLNDEKFEEAIYHYKQALSINPEYDFALRNLGVAYKNFAAELQNKEKEKKDADPNYEIDMTEVYEVLDQSVEYFEKAVNTERYAQDFSVISDILNIYEVKENKEKIKQYLTKLEALESTITDEAELQSYYYKLIKIYSDLGESKKLEEVQNKIK